MPVTIPKCLKTLRIWSHLYPKPGSVIFRVKHGLKLITTERRVDGRHGGMFNLRGLYGRTDSGLSQSKNSLGTALIVERDSTVRRMVGRGLADRGYEILSTSSAAYGLQLAVSARPEVVLLGLKLPDLDGLTVLRMIRSFSVAIIMIISPFDDEAVVLRALNEGADDCVVKPISVPETVARVEAMRRRSAQRSVPHEVIEVGDLRVDVGNRRVRVGHREIALTRTEFDLLAILALKRGRVVARSAIIQAIWGRKLGESQALAVHISCLRRKLGESATRPKYVHTVRGVGFRLET